MDINLKDKGQDKSQHISIMSTTWGTLLFILILTLASVGIYSPIKNYAFSPGYQYGIEQYFMLIFAIGGVSVTLLTTAVFSIPYQQQKNTTIVQLFNGLYLEFKFLLWLAFFIASAIFANVLLAWGLWDLEKVIVETRWIFYFIGIPVTFKFYTLIYLSLCYTKHLYYNGFLEGFVKNSLLGKLIFYIIEGVEKVADADLGKEYHKKLLTALGINLFAIFIFQWTGAFGIILALAYTILLHNSAHKILDKAKILHEASASLASGNFNINLPEDMGLLTPFSRNLHDIKEGFKRAVEEEVKSQNMKTQLITNVSHDLKTPLTSIITYVDLLKNDDIDEDTRKEYLEVLDRKSQRLRVLIEDLFEVSRAASGDLELRLEQLDVIALLRQTLGEMEEKIQASDLEFRLALPEHKILCDLDGQRVYRVFENILSNILKYSLKHTRVYINVEETEEEVELVFKNISSYEMNFEPEEIFERFVRGDKSRSTEGSGLGLAIAKNLVELQGGNLDIDIDGDLFKLKVGFKKA